MSGSHDEIEMAMIITRFAPSPTGHLHLGHAYSALFAFQKAQQAGGKFLLRIEDIDPVRCKDDFIDDLKEDLHWLGLTWEELVRRQSEHLADYQQALAILREQGLIYPCFCTRRDVEAEAAASVNAPHQGPDGLVYPGTCRNLSAQERKNKMAVAPRHVWRLDVKKACAQAGSLTWRDQAKGLITARPEDFGDVVLARKDVPASYHLSVTVDDSLQGVTLVTRGEDLFRATDIHRLLQKLLNYKTPDYHHHKLLLNESGKRYAKRDSAQTLRSLRAEGKSPEDIKRMMNF
jgi:glutamyl-Q tRNA(Asp) synthetase